MIYIFRWLFIFTVLFGLTACSHHPAYVYSHADSIEKPYKSDSIFLMLPNEVMSEERKVAIVLRDELIRQGFNLAPNFPESNFILTFAVNRSSYNIGSQVSDANSNKVPFLTINSSSTYKSQHTDTVIFMHLLTKAGIEEAKPNYRWEGSVATNEHVFEVLPHSTVKNIFEKFGENFEGSIIVDKDYQKDINKQQIKELENSAFK